MKSFIDETVWGIFAERGYELSYDASGRFSIYRKKEEAEAALKTIQPSMWPWRIAPIRIHNGGFVANQEEGV